MDGIETTTYLKKHFPNIKIIILTKHTSDEFIVHLIEEGAHGFLAKDNDIEIIIDAIHSVHENGFYLNEDVNLAMAKGLVRKRRIRPKFAKVDLTEREIDVIRLVYKEKKTKEIADILNIEPQSVSNYKNSIIDKTKSKNIIGAVMYAMKHNLLE